jgi:tRNA(adenine34) deaminase
MSNIQFIQDQHWMQQALVLAHQAATSNEIPVGAILVLKDEIIGRGWNQSIVHCDPTSHAEIIALRDAAKNQKNYRLLNITLYVTLEPCAMCVGALLNARIKRLVFGAVDPKAGAVASVFHLLDTKKLNHRIDWEGGCLAEESGKLLQEFFQARRTTT